MKNKQIKLRKKIILATGIIFVGAIAPMVMQTNVIRTHNINTKLKNVTNKNINLVNVNSPRKILQGQQFLLDYYNFSSTLYSSSIFTLIKKLDINFNSIGLLGVKVTPIKFMGGTTEEYRVNLKDISFSGKTKSFDVLVLLNLNTNSFYYPMYKSNLNLKLGNPSDSGSDVSFILYLQNIKVFNRLLSNVFNSKTVSSEVKPRATKYLDISTTGFSVIYQNDNYIYTTATVSWYNIESNSLVFHFSAIYNKKTGFTLFPEISNNIFKY